MLRPARKSTFRRTIKRGKEQVTLVFERGQAIDLKEADIKQLARDLKVALVPCRKDGKGKVRPIYDDVIAASDKPKKKAPVKKADEFKTDDPAPKA